MLNNIISDETHTVFEGHLHRFQCDNTPPVERAQSAKAMIRMVAQEEYVPRVILPDDLIEQLHRIDTGSASPTHALEALVGGEAIGALNMAEGQTGHGR